MSTFNAPAGRSFRASNTEAGSMMLRGSRSKSLYMDCAGRTWLLDLFPPPTGCSHDIIVTPYDITTLDLGRTWLLDLFPPPTGCSHDIIVTPYDITTLDLDAAVSIR